MFLLIGAYNPDKKMYLLLLDHMSKCLDNTLSNFDHFLILDDLNSLMSEKEMKDFCSNLIKEPTCFKNANNQSSIDVILTNTKNIFHNSIALETENSDHHNTVMKIYSEKQMPITINYRSYKNFNIHILNDDLKNALEQYNKPHMSYRDFKSIFI